MSAQQPASLTEWLANLPISWLVGGPNGSLEWGAWGSILDGQVSLLRQALKARFPDFAPTDALTHLGGDRNLIQGPAESDQSFTTRCKDVWGEASRAGTACGVLEQLAYFGQSANAVWVQQNGLSYQLSATPTPGQDPTSLVTITSLSTLGTALTSSLTPPTATSAGRSIPAGNSWWLFDFNTDNCNRFAIVYPSWPFSSLATATFSNSDSAAITWPIPFASSTYGLLIGPPSDNVVLHADGTTQTATGITIRSSAAWTGSVYVIGYAAGVNPLNFFSAASFGILQRIIATWRPNSLCMGVYWFQSGRIWGYPATVKWGDGGTWGGASRQILGVF